MQATAKKKKKADEFYTTRKIDNIVYCYYVGADDSKQFLKTDKRIGVNKGMRLVDVNINTTPTTKHTE